MSDDLKPPVAIRITRPYTTETEFLEREFDTLTHTGVTLLGAQTRPQGVVLRFEIVLKNGESLLRGEGRVVGFKERAYAGEPGLVLRFTRLDSRSKSVVDKASALREARVRASSSLMSMPAVVVPKPMVSGAPHDPPRPAPTPILRASSIPPPLPPRPTRTPPPLPAWAKAGANAPPDPEIPIDIESTQVDSHFDPFPQPAAAERASAKRPSLPPLPPSEPVIERVAEAPPAPSPPSPPAEPRIASAPVAKRPARPVSARPPAPARPSPLVVSPSPLAGQVPALASSGSRRTVERPPQRDALLGRLRDRARALPSARVREILAKHA